MKKDEMGVACDTCGEDEKCIGDCIEERLCLEELRIYWKTVLKVVLEGWDGNSWTRSI